MCRKFEGHQAARIPSRFVPWLALPPSANPFGVTPGELATRMHFPGNRKGSKWRVPSFKCTKAQQYTCAHRYDLPRRWIDRARELNHLDARCADNRAGRSVRFKDRSGVYFVM
mmetsp:Transcript_85267/g.255519  ORF Transcript_85267/g.255519 Transcript_85267/m.255519 type:complete len:113 (-) Transcript_85267:46-384(-)|eukprot:4033602-Prymnesium_polylepis.2